MVYKTKKNKNKRELRRKTKKASSKIKRIKEFKGGQPEPPTLMSNLENAGKLALSMASNVVAKGLKATAEKAGLDPNANINDNVHQLTNNIKNVNAVLRSPEGEQLKTEATELLKDTVDILKPSAEQALTIGNELLQKEIPIIGNMANEAVLMVPGAGTVIGAIEEAGNVAQAGEAAAESVAKLTVTGTEAMEKMEEQKKRAENMWSNVSQIANNVSNGINSSVADGINSLQQKVDEQGAQINKSMQQLHKEAQMIGGRSHKSQLSFLAPHVNGSKILRKTRSKL